MTRQLTLDDLERARQVLEEQQVPGPFWVQLPGMEEPLPLEEFDLEQYLLELEREK